jgi:hypothetical protein
VHHLSNQINPLLTTYLRSIWNLPRSTPNHLLLTIANLPCLTCECYLEALMFLSRKLARWQMNSPLIECVLLEMFRDLSKESWLSHMLDFVQTRLQIPIDVSSFEAFKANFLLIDRETLRHLCTKRCHEVCFPPSSSKAPYYSSIALTSANTWLCFTSASSHYRLSRIFVSNSFRFCRSLSREATAAECESCHEPQTVEHWFHCPRRASERDLFVDGTGVQLTGPQDLPRVMNDPVLLTAFEFAISRFFRPPSQGTAVP